MPTCSFCKRSFKEPRGLTIFTFDGKAIHFCSSKCRRNMALKRDPRKTNWVKRSSGFVAGKDSIDLEKLEKESDKEEKEDSPK